MTDAQDKRAAGRPDPVRAAEVIAALNRFLSEKLGEPGAGSGRKHRQLTDVLISAMADGVVREGDKLPSESELTSMTPFSLGTVQKALKALMQDGFIARKPGVGSIVRPWRQSMARPLHCRFAGSDGVFLPVYPRVIGRRHMREKGRWNDALGDKANIVRIDRRILIGDLFSVLTKFYVDADQFPLFETYPIHKLDTENFKLLMSGQSGSPVAYMEHRLKFAPAPAEAAEHIDVPEGTLVLFIIAVARASGGQALYHQEFFIPPNDLELSIESRLDGVTGI